MRPSRSVLRACALLAAVTAVSACAHGTSRGATSAAASPTGTATATPSGPPTGSANYSARRGSVNLANPPVTNPQYGVQLVWTAGIGPRLVSLAGPQGDGTTVALELDCSAGPFSLTSQGKVVFQGSCTPKVTVTAKVPVADLASGMLTVDVKPGVVWSLHAWQR